ncbi:hypothetical protein [Onishia taeanensis]
MKLFNQRHLQAFPAAPAGDPAFAPLYDERMRWPIRRAWLQVSIRDSFQAAVGLPVEKQLLRLWMYNFPCAGCLENWGLPRRAVEHRLQDDLVLHVDPRQLIRITDWRGHPRRLRPSSSAFIWDGEWDLKRGDLRFGSRYRFISDLDDHRDDLRKTERFQELKARLDAGQPWSSHQQGILLDSEHRILTYLRVYLSFHDDMAARGFDASRGKDQLGVAVSREGKLIKINRGLHRLAMAQRIGLPFVPVTVKAVHREWWERVTQGVTGQEALKCVKAALKQCSPETEAGPLDPRHR